MRIIIVARHSSYTVHPVCSKKGFDRLSRRVKIAIIAKEYFYVGENLMSNVISSIRRKPMIPLVVFLVAAVILIIVSTAALSIPIVPVCTIVILEALLAALLRRIPLWIHGLVAIAEIVVGVLCAKAVFMILMTIVYVLAVALLFVWSTEEA